MDWQAVQDLKARGLRFTPSSLLLGTLSEPGPRLAESGLRDIEDGNLTEAEVKEPIDQDRGPAAHVDDSPPFGGSDGPDEFEREPRLVLIPAHARLGLGRVDVFPVRLAVGGDHGAILDEPQELRHRPSPDTRSDGHKPRLWPLTADRA